ncbi:MAG: ATP-dependent helicase [Alphaproteobacteria bacterium]|nr:ATP-dependent helicase [Alphaproteobacteria bacterium]
MSGRPAAPGAGVDLTGLNDAQRAAVTAPSGFHLVVAGAGTGKTRTLVHRVAWLLEQGADPSGIVLLTFTRRAAREMLDRASRMVGPKAHRVQGGTFHAYASRVLRTLARDGFAERIGRSGEFTVMDRRDAEDLVGLVRNDLGVGAGGRRFPNKATLLKFISRQANAGGSLQDAVDAVNPRFLDDLDGIEAVARAYAARKQQADLVDYDDLLVLLRDLLRRDADARARVAGRCQHVLVDEYQDTNRVQGHIAALLATAHGDLMVVGDEAQSIYAFRGARVENILDFPKVFAGARVTKLEANYRSTQPVLDLANGVLESFSVGFDKRLYTELDHKGAERPMLVEVADVGQEADVVVANVLAMREAAIGLADQAVLFRAAFHSAVLESALTRAGIPFRKYGGLRFVEAAHIKDVLSLLRLVANPRDEVAWLRVLSWIQGIGPKTAGRIIDAALAPGGLSDADAFAGRAWHAELERLIDLLRVQRDLPLHRQVDAAVEYVRSGLDARYDDAWKRERDLTALPVLADRYDSLDAFLADVALDPPEAADAEADEEEDEQLTLSTVHSAKGLEWTGVQVLRLADGQFPSGYSLDDPDALEEERRLLYVAVTRAKRHLLLYQPRFVEGRGSFGVGPGCVLLEEVPGLDDRVQRMIGRAPAPPDGGGDGLPSDPAAQERLDQVLAWMDD